MKYYRVSESVPFMGGGANLKSQTFRTTELGLSQIFQLHTKEKIQCLYFVSMFQSLQRRRI